MADISSPKELPIQPLKIKGERNDEITGEILNKINEIIVTMKSMSISHVTDMEKLQERISDLE